MMGKRISFLMGIIFYFLLLNTNASAYIAPYYSYGETWVHDYSISTFPYETDTFEGPSGGSALAGSDIWNWGNVVIEVGDYAQGGKIIVNPGTGIMKGQTETFGYGAITGSATASGYMSQAFRVTSDGSLNIGDSVSVQANFALDGEFSGPGRGNVKGIVFLNKVDNSNQDMYYHSNDYLDFGLADQIYWEDDITTNAMLGLIYFAEYKTGVAGFSIDFNETIEADVSVGDIVLIETMLWIETNAISTDGVQYSHADFDNTLSSQLSSLTAGATLEPVPVPSSILLLLPGIMILFGIKRKLR